MEYDTLPESEEMVAKIVSFLAERGVRQSDVSAQVLGYTQDNQVDVLFANAMKWLIDEGIVRQTALHETQGGMAKGCVLTSRGFALLAQPFEGSLTLGTAIRKTAESGAGYSNVGDLLGGLLGGFTKSLGS
ncbi:MAG: hypothetical protein RIG84_14565 [Roseovarius sp.]